MIYTMFKFYFHNAEPKLLSQKDYKQFLLEILQEDFRGAQHDFCSSYDDFDHIFTSKLNKHTTKRKVSKKPTLIKPYARPLRKDQDLRTKQIKLKT